MLGKPHWKTLLSFSDRFGVINKLAAKIQNDQCVDATDARVQAKETEKGIFQSSVTLEDYDEQCDLAVRSKAGDPYEGHVTDDEDDESPDTQAEVAIGKYIQAKHYRDGLFSFIFKARAPSDDEEAAVGQMVALKVTTPSMVVEPHDSAREARILKSMQHDHVVPLLDLFRESRGRLILVFPFLPYDLQALLVKQRVDQEQARSHLRDMFGALAYLHSSGIIHRDIKPSNILLETPSGPAYLADFGIAWSPHDEASEKHDAKITDVGTTSYRPLELLFGNKKYDCSLDLWAAGCVLAETASLTGDSLFDSGDLGSELALIQSIFKSLGTPTLDTWPEAAMFPDWGKMAFKDFQARPWSELLPKAPEAARDLVSKLVHYESGQRLCAQEALEHPYLAP